MALIESFTYSSLKDPVTGNHFTYHGSFEFNKALLICVYSGESGFLFTETNGNFLFRLDNTPTTELKHMVFIGSYGDTVRYHFVQYGSESFSLLSLQRALQNYFGDKTQVRFMHNCRFKIHVKERTLLMNGRPVAIGTMDNDKSFWIGDFYGRTWQKQIGEDFILYMRQHFDFNWAHKVVCQRRGHYQFLPNVALFFDSVNELVLKLINRPNEKDSCEGFYVGRLLGKGFGYHIDGNNEKIPLIDSYVKNAVEDILGSELSEEDFQTERFITDVEYREQEGRWVLTSSIGDIAYMVKGPTPENTCAIRKHVTWVYDIFGQPINQIPLLENLLINAFYRGYQRLAKQLGL